ncbi:het-6OR heterokaryon incompatibility (het-6OR allele) [Fusarium heterosporum]|uniref:Het-6OR heterokaryon incompatibility (Het-6OR allele) n=1 Tax=Fusarium heterosporum TaxID=42747 RepID=A0A8H5SX54_FUSHE|nr:het-6OR heterokaryon incompatibility (het-6OR allele) [Fusarium heterosporum]
MNHTQGFDYSSVQLRTASSEIRLLDLYPSQDLDRVANAADSRLSCRLYTTIIENPSPYIALSYVWGDGQKCKSIWAIDASDTCEESSIPITESLQTALRHLRRSDKIITLWIDQICINQADNDEKGEQVGMMGSLYSRATQVLVWLGPAQDGSDVLMEAWQDIGQSARDFGVESYMTRERYHLISAIMKNADPTNEATMHFQDLLTRAVDIFAPLIKSLALKMWLERPYFSRVWTIQEFCLCADTVFVCGTKSLPVELVRLAVIMIQAIIRNIPQFDYEAFRPPEMPLERLAEISDEPTAQLFACRSRHQRHADYELHMLLRRLFVDHDTCATVHRDRVFALLGLAADAKKLGIKLDYGSAEGTTERVLTETARALIEKGGQIAILSYSQFPKLTELINLPSWAPDWRSNLRPSFYTINERSDDHLFAASGHNSNVEIAEDRENNPNSLGLQGYTVDVVELVAGGEGWMDMSWDHERYLGFFNQVDALWRKSMEKVDLAFGESTHSRREEARWRVPIGDIYWTWEGNQRRATPDVAMYHSQCLEELNLFAAMTRGASIGETDWLEQMNWEVGSQGVHVKHTYRESMRKMQGKRPFLTQMGYLGMGPVESQPGDVVVVFCGGHIPFVLRPIDSDIKFELVGEAYCDGIMDGEIATGEIDSFWVV